MKQSIARQHPQHRNSTPSVIYLPSSKPPIVAKRPLPVPAETAIVLPDTPEPLVTERTEVATPQTPNPNLNRQARRKALRAEAKALRRQGQPPAPAEATKRQTPIPAPASVPQAATAAALPPAAPPPSDGPLPRALSLVAAKPRGMALFAHRLRGFLGLARTNVASGPTETMIASQLRTLRSELAVLQRSIDQIIDRAPA